MNAQKTAALVVIGDEILSGRTKEANLAVIAERLGAAGVRLAEARIVADEIEEIASAVNALRRKVDYLLTTGGIGPTHDDKTAAAIAHALGRPLVRNADAEARLRAFYPENKINEARLSMADMPEGVEALLDNPISAAPGFRIDNVFVLAGVPKIMSAMLDHLIPSLEGGPPSLSFSLGVYLPEGELAAGLAEIAERWPKVAFGSYPFQRDGRFGAILVARTTDRAILDEAALALETLAAGAGAETFDPRPR